MNLKKIITILPYKNFISLKDQGITDTAICRTYHITKTDLSLLSRWYGFLPANFKVKRPFLHLTKKFHALNMTTFCRSFKRKRYEEMYLQYQRGARTEKLAEVYSVDENHFHRYILQREKEDKIKRSRHLTTTVTTPLTPSLLKRYKEKCLSDTVIAIMHGVSTVHILRLRKKHGIRGVRRSYMPLIKKKIPSIVREYRKGTRLVTLCAIHGINLSNYYKIINSFFTEEDKRIRRKNRFERKRKEILRLQRLYKFDKDIAKVLGVTRQRVQQIREECGVGPIKPT